ncbi:hypothetical protein HDR58_09920 [bacterium]|nr:hypothetical protein [bacterium]
MQDKDNVNVFCYLTFLFILHIAINSISGFLFSFDIPKVRAYINSDYLSQVYHFLLVYLLVNACMLFALNTTFNEFVHGSIPRWQNILSAILVILIVTTPFVLLIIN